MSETTRQFRLAKRPSGRPDSDAFELVETEVPEPDAGEVLVRTLTLSVDPYMRGRMRDAESYAEPWDVGEPLRAGAVGEVVASDHERWRPGDLVVGRMRWADFSVVDGDDLRPADADVAPPAAYLGVLGMPGRTAYFGLLEVGDPSPGETVVVSGAAGAVGSTVGQIADLAGCRVVGFAGTDRKVSLLESDLGFDAAVNYAETSDLGAALDEAAPGGVDVYYDNVGGPVTDAVFPRLNVDARVPVCGQISLYNEETVPDGPRKLPHLVATRARVEGFLVRDFEPRYERANRRLAEWVSNGSLEHVATVTDGLENAPEAFLGLFEGENVGKQLVSVAEPARGD